MFGLLIVYFAISFTVTFMRTLAAIVDMQVDAEYGHITKAEARKRIRDLVVFALLSLIWPAWGIYSAIMVPIRWYRSLP